MKPAAEATAGTMRERMFCMDRWMGPDGAELLCFLVKGHRGEHNYLTVKEMQPMTLSGSKLLRMMKMAKEFNRGSAVVPFAEALAIVDALEAPPAAERTALKEILELTRLPDADWKVRAAIRQRAMNALGLAYNPNTDSFIDAASASEGTKSE